MLLTKEVEIKLSPRTINHYRELGYSGKLGDVIIVKAEDLTNGSHAKVKILCDYCKDEIVEKPYKVYLESLKVVNKTACNNCLPIKRTECTYKLYGVNSISELQSVKEKRKNTCIEKYGVNNVIQYKPFRDKRDKVFLEKYGATIVGDIKEFQERAKITNLLKYGFENPFSSPEIKGKIVNSFYKNSSQAVSSQQLYLNDLYDGELNYPIKYYNVDICFPEIKLCIEYDGGGHDLSVKTKQVTKEEFNKKEIVRNSIIRREGYKQMRIISSKDLLPSDEILLQMLEHAKQYFLNYPCHSWIEFNIDTSFVCNAENKDGVFYDYGELRRIKKSDVEDLRKCIESA